MAILVSEFSTRLMLALLLIGVSNAQLSSNFYNSTCPNLVSIISQIVDPIVSNNPLMGASLLRLHYTDCFVNGCDASILLDDTTSFIGEKHATANGISLRGFDIIDNIKAQVEIACPGIVSCADILTLAAREAVVTASVNAPSWSVFLGRRDSITTSLSDANSQMPTAGQDLNALISVFSNKGFTVRDLVALSGAHTIGQARCTNFRDRIYNETNINPLFAAVVRSSCPMSGSDNNVSPLDIMSPRRFNNDYFVDLMSLNGLLHSDQQLFSGGSTDAQVKAYATNSDSFFKDFSAAMTKMSNLSPLTGTNGEVRLFCRRPN